MPANLSLCFFLILISVQASSEEEKFQPIPTELASKYHFDLSKAYYPDEQSFQIDKTEAEKIAEELQAYRGKVTASGAGLLEVAQKTERLNLLMQKMYVYRYLNYAVNTKLEPQLSAIDRANSDLSAKIAFVSTELRKLPEADLQKLIDQEPKLALYRFFLQQNVRYKPHTLTTDQEELLSRLSPELYSWQSQMFQKILDRTKFSEIKTDNGTWQVYRDRSVLMKEKDRNIRKEAMLKLYDEYGANADLLGFILLKESQALNSGNKIRQFEDAFAGSLFDAYLEKKQVDTFFDEIGKSAPLMQRYVRMRKDRIKAISGIESVEPWDMEVVPPNYQRPRFTIAETTDTLKKALAFHGKNYSDDLAHLLDPSNRRLDIVQGENRVPGAFAWGYYGAPFVFYSFTFHGFIDDVLTLAHEAGHVVHYDLIQKNKVPPVYADGPSYFTESFAMLNEFVTTDFLYKNAKTKDDKIFFLETWLSNAMRRFFDIVMRSEFEYLAYQKIGSNEITEAEQLHQLWKQEGLKYIGEDYQKHDFLKYNWSLTPHFFSSPRYYINYLFANLMAINYYYRHFQEPGFDARYVTLMENGFPDTPIQLLQKHLNLNPFDPEAVKASMTVFEQRLGELATLYQQ